MNNLRDEEADRMIMANGEAEAARLREAESEVADYRESIDGLRKSLESLTDVKEFAHKENVRVYRNVQASLQEELDKRNAEMSKEIALQNEALTKLVSDQRDEMKAALSKQKEDIEAVFGQDNLDNVLEKRDAELREKLEQSNRELREEFARQNDELKSELAGQRDAFTKALTKQSDDIQNILANQDNGDLISSVKAELGAAAERQAADLKSGIETINNGLAEAQDNQALKITGDVSSSVADLIPSDLGAIKNSPIQVVTFLFTVLNTAAIVVLILMQLLSH